MPEASSSNENDFQPVRRPLLGIVFCYLAGTCAGAWIGGIHFLSILALALVALTAAFGLHKAAGASDTGPRRASLARLSGAFLFLAVFFAGWLALDLRINNPSPLNLARLMDKPREGIEIIGVVADDPALRKNWRADRQYWSFAMQIVAVSRTGAFQKTAGETFVSMPTNAVADNPRYGERWRLNGAMSDKALLSAASGLDALKSRLPGRFAFQVSDSPRPVLMAEPSPRDFIYRCFQLRQKCADILTRGIKDRPETVAILQALVLGRQHELPNALREAFVATGTYHIFAISGQHVAIIAMFIIVVLQFSGVCRLHWFYYLAPALVVFTVMTGMSASAVRGCLMALLCFLGPLFLRRPDIPSAMALAALIIVGADPLQLFQAGFLLSFGIVAGLIVLCPPLIAAAEKMTGPDPYQLELEGWGRRRARMAARWLIFMVIASIAAWLVSTPLIARWFNLISPVAVIANLCVIPLATLVLLAGCLAIVFGWWCPLIAEAFNSVNVWFVSLMTWFTVTLARVPFGHVFVKSPPVWFVGLWLVTLVVWRLYYRKAKIWFAAFLILLLAGVGAWLVQKKEWEIHVLNIDRCAVCLVKAGGENILLNCGPRYQTRNVLRYLRKNGVNRVQTLFCPRPDSGRVGAASEITAAIRVNEISRGTNRLEAGKVTVKIGADEKTPITACISINVVSAPITVEVEEQGMTWEENNVPASGSNAQFRIVCRPINEERNQDVSSQTLEFQSPVQIDLGPGRGVVISPDKNGIEIRPISFRQ